MTATTGWTDGVELHLTSSMIAGLVTTTITNPIDVIKTRMFVGECSGHSVCWVHERVDDELGPACVLVGKWGAHAASERAALLKVSWWMGTYMLSGGGHGRGRF